MDKLFSMIQGARSTEITNIDQNIFLEFLSKNSVWDFYEMSREEYSNKDSDQKLTLIIRYYNEMVKGKIHLSFLFVFC